MLLSRIKSENVDLPAGLIQIGAQEYGIRTNALYKAPAQIADTIVAMSGGVPVRLRDIATVSDSIQEQRVFSRVNGTPSVQLTITAQPNANIVDVAAGINDKINDINQRHPTIKWSTMLDQREFILTALASLQHTAIYGAILAVLIILLFLHSWRATVIVAVSLPISVLGTLFIGYVTHQSLNVMTLGGLALAVGLIVDDAVVVIENISRFLRTGMQPADAAEGATAQILGAVFASSITVVTVFLPLMLIPGIQGLIFGPFAIVVMSGVGISFIVAILTVPMLATELLRRDQGQAADGASEPPARESFGARFDRLYARLEAAYRAALNYCLDRPARVIGSAAALLGITMVVLALGVVPTEIFPPSDSRFVQFDLQAPNGAALGVTNQISRMVENALLKDPACGRRGRDGRPDRRWRQRRARSPIAPASKWRSSRGRARPAQPASCASGARDSMERLARACRAAGTARGHGRHHRAGQTIDIVQRQISQGQTALELEIFGPDINTLADNLGRRHGRDLENPRRRRSGQERDQLSA